MSASVLLERDGGVAVLTLNRPDRLNSFSTEMTTRLKGILDELERDPTCRSILLTGAGRGFCAGQDLSERSVAPGGAGPRVDVGQSIETRFNPLVRKMRAMPKPIIVAVNGVAAGAGANIALQGDIVLAAKSARFSSRSCCSVARAANEAAKAACASASSASSPSRYVAR